MKPTEVVALLRYVGARYPHQKADEYTADTWEEDLLPYRLEDAKTAVVRMAKTGNPFLSVVELADEIRNLRNERIERLEEPPPPAAIADDPKLCIEFSKEWRRRAGDGDFDMLTEEQYKQQVMGHAVKELAAAQSRQSVARVVEEIQTRMREAVERKAAEKTMHLEEIRVEGDALVRKFEETYYADDIDCPDCGDRYVQADVYVRGMPNEADWTETVQRRCPEGHVWVVRKTNEID